MPTKKKPKNLVQRAQEALGDPELSNLARYTVDHVRDERFNDLDKKEGHFRGTMYDRRPYDWHGNLILSDQSPSSVGRAALGTWQRNERPPVSLRRPNSKYALGRIVARRFAAMLFGNRVFPQMAVPKSDTTEKWLNGLVNQVQMKMHMYNAAALGAGMGSVVVMFKVVNGRFRLEMLNAKWIIPLWEDFHENEMRAFSVCYPFAKQVYDRERNGFVTKTFLYRRLVTKDLDIEFEPQPAKVAVQGNGLSVKPADPDAPLTINPERVFEHGLNFVPAQYIQHLPRPDQTDGDSAYEAAMDLIDRINENLAAIHSALQANLDPTLVLKITPDDYKKLMSMGGVVHTGQDGEGLVVGDKGDAKYIQIEVENLAKAMEILDKLRTYALELCDCVIADPHKLSGAAQSASAIQLLYSPMLAMTDVLRVQYGEQALRRLLGKMIRAYHIISSTLLESDDSDDTYRQAFKPIQVKDPKTQAMVTVEPDEAIEYDDISLVWGEYFPPTTADVFQAAEAGVMATGGKPITTQEKAARAFAPYSNDHDIEQTISDLETQAKEEEAQALKLAKTSAAVKAKAAPPQPGAKKKSE